ncbi:MAG: hypothetical protein P0Y53_05535 [Candidatus Pseudobacter hemicellulosilyticus]|uniref:Uncharacterized protein n=1 Tax=Candidatus Pseudobacter hemicellulosilyticus TaxID=3121375 RepID=A0AAJ5WWQ2_9BACT|nr:MAG: hypothetical protein P0Y53_05535 [Pseudobacter sp.]
MKKALIITIILFAALGYQEVQAQQQSRYKRLSEMQVPEAARLKMSSRPVRPATNRMAPAASQRTAAAVRYKPLPRMDQVLTARQQAMRQQGLTRNRKKQQGSHESMKAASEEARRSVRQGKLPRH